MKYVFLDLDGTLTDAGVGILNSVDYALGRMERPLLDRTKDQSWIIGPPLWDTFRTLGIPEDQLDHAVALYRERYSVEGYLENKLYDGILDQLKLLDEAGYIMCLATSKALSYATKITDHFGITPYLADQFGSQADGTHADKPSLIAHGVSTMGAEADHAIMVGDRKYDIEGAKANGIKSVGVLYGYGGLEELTEAGADDLIQTPNDFAPVIMRNLPL